MKILIIEDKKSHIEAAYKLLARHELTVVTTADDAFAAFEGPEFPFEAVLTDMLMPNSTRAGGNRNSFDKESPYGLNFLWRAAAKPGVKFIGLLTDANHHSGTMAAAFDGFPLNTVFTVNQAKAILCREASHSFVDADGKTVYGKAWDTVLDYLTGA